MNTDLPSSKSSVDQLDPEQKIRVLIVDDHAVVRQGLRTFLELHGDLSSDDPSALPIEVVGEATNGDQAVNLSQNSQPDLVLLDLVMPIMDGVEATAKIVQSCPNTHVIILTSFGEEERVIHAIQAGAKGYLLKDISPDDLVKAVREAYHGRVQLHPEAAKRLMSAIAAKEALPSASLGRPFIEELTEREVEVLGLIAEGLNNRDIAARMVISEKTVKSHVSSILGKLHLEDRTQAAIYALRHGLGTDES